MTTDVATPAILQYIDSGVYPESEDTASAILGTDALHNLLHELQAAQDSARNEIRTLSQTTAPDIDTWISRAHGLQADILRSRDTARAIVAEAESGRDLRAKIEDAGNKVGLLEREVAFNETLTATLEHVRYANDLLGQVQNAAVLGELEVALERLQQAEASIGGLEGLKDNRTVALLERRASGLKESLEDLTTECWDALIEVDSKARSVEVKTQELETYPPGSALAHTALEDVVKIAQGLGIFDTLVQKLAKNVDRVILKQRMKVNDDGQVADLTIENERLSCSGSMQDTSYATLFSDLERMIDFLATCLPSSITPSLSAALIPSLATRLEEHWLEPAVPLDITEMPGFQDTLSCVQRLADRIDHHGWHGTKLLREWVRGAPRTWLTKRREAVLGEVRNLVFAGLRDTKIAERVETQVVAHDDRELGLAVGGTKEELAEGEGGDADWDTAWDEPEPEETTSAPRAQNPRSEAVGKEHAEEDIEDASAWDLDDPEDKTDEGSGDGDEDDAWGWGDDQEATNGSAAQETAQNAPSAISATSAARANGKARAPQDSNQREVTLRETFTVTLIPEKLLVILKSIVDDAQTLAGPSYSESPIAPAASALYTLPTLALAIYRATAPTAYTKAPSGNSNMLIYNDCSHLANELRSWQASQPPASRLRLDGDVKALESFARRAYSSEMESQRTILRDLLDGAQGFSNCTTPPYKGECESAVQQVVLRLRDVHGLWKGVLSNGALLQSSGSLLATVTGKLISEIEDLGDIGEADSHQLRRLLDKVSELRDHFTQADETGAGGEGGRDLTFIYCPNWLKFQYLGEILESSLADIKYLWNEGELSLEFTADEVVELIEALFAESDLRRRAVTEIRRGGRR